MRIISLEFGYSFRMGNINSVAIKQNFGKVKIGDFLAVYNDAGYQPPREYVLAYRKGRNSFQIEISPQIYEGSGWILEDANSDQAQEILQTWIYFPNFRAEEPQWRLIEPCGTTFLTVNQRFRLTNPNDAAVNRGLRSLKVGQSCILSRGVCVAGQDFYSQLWRRSGAEYQLEYRQGTSDNHWRTIISKVATAVDFMTAWNDGAELPKDSYSWENIGHYFS